MSLASIPQVIVQIDILTSKVESDNHFITDANGFERRSRQFDSEKPIPGNYFPMVSFSGIEDSSNMLVVLSDRAHGFTSLASGHLEKI